MKKLKFVGLYGIVMPMSIPLIGLHAALGELGGLLFLWVFVEMLSPSERRIKRAQSVALVGLILLLSAWIVGGYYYVTYYGQVVKPVIKEGPLPWAHSVVMETKEHVFLFLPFLSIVVWGLLRNNHLTLMTDTKMRVALLVLIAEIVLITLAMAGMGFMISAGFRSALEAVRL